MSEEELIIAALDEESYEWLGRQNFKLLAAIEKAVRKGMTPEAVKRLVSRSVWPERQAFVQRCFEAARHVERQMRQE